MNITPRHYLELFQRKERRDVKGIVGRFIRGTDESCFECLSDEKGKRLSWVCSEELMSTILGMTPLEALLCIGKTMSWIESRLYDGTQHRLMVFPVEEGNIATWDNLFALVEEHFGSELFNKLAPFHDGIKRIQGYTDVDYPNADLVMSVSDLAVHEKHEHPDFMSPDKYLSLDNPTLSDARAFYYHSIGCNKLFRGDGYSPEGMPELIVPNRRLTDISGAVQIPLDITIHDVKCMKSKIHGGKNM
jgi:hypothetical protein